MKLEVGYNFVGETEWLFLHQIMSSGTFPFCAKEMVKKTQGIITQASDIGSNEILVMPLKYSVTFFVLLFK